MTSRLFRIWSIVLITGLVLNTCGCGSGKKKVPVGQVQGRITIDGAPVADGCQVQFASKEGVLAGIAMTKGGDFKLMASGLPTIPTGDYTIQIQPPVRSQEEEKAESDKMKGLLIQSAMAVKEGKPLPVIPPYQQEEVLPKKYWVASTSQLKFTVKEGDNTADFELTKKDAEPK